MVRTNPLKIGRDRRDLLRVTSARVAEKRVLGAEADTAAVQSAGPVRAWLCWREADSNRWYRGLQADPISPVCYHDFAEVPATFEMAVCLLRLGKRECSIDHGV